MKEIHRTVIIKAVVPEHWDKMTETEQLAHLKKIQDNGILFSIVKIKQGNHTQ